MSIEVAIATARNTPIIFLLIIAPIPIIIWIIYFVFANNKMGKIEKKIQKIEKKIEKRYYQLGVNINKLK